MEESSSKLEMVQVPVQGIHFGRLEFRLESGVQNPYLPAAVEKKGFLSCPSFWSSGPGLDKESTEHKKGVMLKM